MSSNIRPADKVAPEPPAVPGPATGTRPGFSTRGIALVVFALAALAWMLL
jgi:hypothetical protein